MNCKFCGAQLEETHLFCPACGSTVANDSSEKKEQVMPEKKKAVAILTISIVGALLALASLVVLLMLALGVKIQLPFISKKTVANNSSTVVENAAILENGNVVVATLGDLKLTNAELQIYYRAQALNELGYYGSGDYNYGVYLLGIDTEKPLSEQTCTIDETKTWEQYFLERAVDAWKEYQLVKILATEAGFTLDAEWEESLASMPEQLEAQAVSSGYENADQLLTDVIGPNCTMDMYMEYVRTSYWGNAFYSTMSEECIPTLEEMSAYFEENKESLEKQGITKEMGNLASVRHILVMPKGDEDTQEYTEEQWEACYKEAEKILNEWKAGEATETSFAQLATKYTEDTASAEDGGLYADIAPGDSYVENFLNWTIDMNRQKGDTDIVKTEYGYHIMYYVEGEPYWPYVLESLMVDDRVTEKINAAGENIKLDVDYSKVVIAELKFS